MPKLSLPWPISRRTITIALATIALIMALTLVILAWMSAQQYQQHMANFKSTLQQEIDKTNQLLLQQKDDDQALPDRTVESLQQIIHQASQELPEQPRILWYNLASSEDTETQSQLRSTLQTVDDRLIEAAQIGSYQRQAHHILQKLHQGQGHNAQQLAELAKTWHQAHQDLDNLIAPQSLQNQHHQIRTILNQVSQQLDQLAKLYTDRKTDDFNHLEQELANNINSLQQVAKSYKQVIIQKDEEVAIALEKLQQMLRVEQ